VPFGDAGYEARVRFAQLRRLAEQIAESVGLHARRAVVLIAGWGAVGVVGLSAVLYAFSIPPAAGL
jgi:hypothetical protein